MGDVYIFISMVMFCFSFYFEKATSQSACGKQNAKVMEDEAEGLRNFSNNIAQNYALYRIA